MVVRLKNLSRSVCRLLIALVLSWSLLGCANQSRQIRLVDLPDIPKGNEVRRLSGPITEVAPPAIFSDLAKLVPNQQPRVAIASPQPNQTIADTQLEVKLNLQNFSIYKDENLDLGPHVQLILDNQPARSIYSLEDTIAFEDLAPGSHTLRAIAVQPWGESFKNETAYAQTSFHVFAPTGENTPDPDLPLLTFVEPQGTFSAEPILLDFYLTNAPLHFLAQEDAADDLSDWKIRATVNGKSFVFDQWQPIYLKGFEPGRSWIQLALIDEQGDPIENEFNSTVRVIDYDPTQSDSLAKLVRGELPLTQAGLIVDPNYQPPIEEPEEILPDELEEIKDELETLESETKAPEAESEQLEREEPETEGLEVEETETEEIKAGELKTEELEIEEPETEEPEVEALETEALEPEASELEPKVLDTRIEGELIVPAATDLDQTEMEETNELPAEETEATPKKSLFGRFFGRKSADPANPVQATEPIIEPDGKEILEPEILEPALLAPSPSAVDAPVEVIDPEDAPPILLPPGEAESESVVTEPVDIEPTDIDSADVETIEEFDVPSNLSAPAESEDIRLEGSELEGSEFEGSELEDTAAREN
ncbi:MAG: hypothetical protein AAF716_18745 [Cyanobacteria bacterium P01_D01_bin.1]